MKTIILICSFLLVATWSSAQATDCKLVINNTTGSSLMIAVRRTTASPNICPPPVSDTSFVIPPGISNITIGVVDLLLDPPVRPYIVGAALWPSMASASWQVNTCWNPSCISSAGPLNIIFTFCGDHETHVTI